MSQKSILSFFKKTPVKATPDAQPKAERTPSPSPRKSRIADDEDNSQSPLLNQSQNKNGPKKRRRIVSSSEEENSPKNRAPAVQVNNSKKARPSNSPPTDDEIEATAKPSPKSATKKATPAKATPKNSKAGPKVKAEKREETTPKATIKKSPASTNKTKKESPTSSDEDDEHVPETSPIKIDTFKPPPDAKPAPKGLASFFISKAKPASTADTAAAAAYNPAKPNYDPVADAFWRAGDKVPYLALTKTFAVIEDTSGRLKMIEYLANFLRSVIALSPDDLAACLYLCLNQLAPAYEGLELGIAETTLMKVIAQTTGRSMAQVKQDARDTGDLGLVAEQSKSNQRMMITPAALTVPAVFAKLRDIARGTGASSMNTKVDKIQGIFVACRHSEARYFIRSLLGKLRIGLAEQSVLQALGQACAMTPPMRRPIQAAAAADADTTPPPPAKCKKPRKLHGDALKASCEAAALIVKTAHCQCPNYDQIVGVLLDHGLDALLEKCPMRPGTPLKPMLAHPTRGIQEVLQRFEGLRFTAEYKYDGERAQIHSDAAGNVNVYSRNQENNTSKYPDIVKRMPNAFAGSSARPSFILDCEAVAWDVERQQILPFQVLSTRKRKDAVEEEIRVQVQVFMFDLLYWDGEPLVTRPFAERRALLRRHFREVPGEWRFASSVDTGDMDELQAFLEEAMRGNCEGLMVKTLDGKDATYEIAKRSRNWLKIKKDYLSGVGDSLDLVVIGGYHGKGKRTGTYGGFLLACYDPDAERYQSICKIGTGFSDDDLQRHTEFLRAHVIEKAKSYYAYEAAVMEADVWFEPAQVWEVLCADLSLSPVHQAARGIIDPEKGISLRFPRFIRIRDDKSVEDATSAQQVADMYANQDQIKNQEKGKGGKDAEEDFY